MGGDLFEFIKQFLTWSAKYIVDFVNLVQFVVAREEGEQRKNFEKHAADAPIVHFVVVVAVSHQALGRAVPARGDVLGEGRLRVDAAAGAEVGELNLVFFEQNIFPGRVSGVRGGLRLDISVEDSVFVHVVDGLQHLV